MITVILWRSFRQMHHSAQRLDTYSAFRLSPLDMLRFRDIAKRNTAAAGRSHFSRQFRCLETLA